jgi:predicted glycosyltransferase involved in capsule biosynthesis
MGKYKLSICTIGKNDGYAGNFEQRIEFSLNKLIENLKILNISDVEILVADWASPADAKLSDVLKLSKCEHLKFIYVPEETATKHSPDSTFPTTIAYNVGNSRSTGEFVFTMDSDTYIPLKTFERFYNFVSNLSTDDPVFYQTSRYHLPYKIHSNSKSLIDIDDYINNWILQGRPMTKNGNEMAEMVLHDKVNISHFQGATCAVLLSRKLLEETTFYWEVFRKWGHMDIEFHHRIQKKYRCNGDLEDALESEFFHLGHHEIKTQGQNGFNNEQYCPNINANGENWGLINEDLEIIKIK